MRPVAFALLLFGATACPAFASGTLIEAKSSTFGCQFSATLNLLPELPTVFQEYSNRILDSVHCLPIDAHQRFTVLRDLPSAYVALKDVQQDGPWVVVFVRKSDFSLLHRSPHRQSAGNRHGTPVHAAPRHHETFRQLLALARQLCRASDHGRQGTSLSDSDSGGARGGALNPGFRRALLGPAPSASSERGQQQHTYRPACRGVTPSSVLRLGK
jgi:hypothetical protein